MRSADGRHTIVYNGELYGVELLRSRLESVGTVFRGRSDTEVLLEAIAHWGVVAALERVEGIFAFAVWDERERRLWLARDRSGVKPLYVADRIGGRALAFASDLAAVEAGTGFEAPVDELAAAEYFRLGYVPDSACVLSGVAKVQPGEVWCYPSAGESPRVVRYFDRDAAVAARATRLLRDTEPAIDELSRTLVSSVERQMVSDVPVGVFLSGGVDSAAVAAAASQLRRGEVETFTIGFDDPRYDESTSARAIARHLHTRHHELILTPQATLDAVDHATAAFNEPFADSSLVPTWLVCRFARETVTVVLSGDGGDELFAGYNRHLWLPRVLRAQQLTPASLRVAAAELMERVPQARWDRLLARLPVRTPGLKVYKLAALLRADGADGLLRAVTSIGPSIAGLDGGSQLHRSVGRALQLNDPLSTLTHHDFVTYLPGDVLTKVDRCSMALGLEARVPLLDEPMVDFAGRLAPSLKIRRGQTKWLLREVLAQWIPRGLFERPKMGFAIPLREWLTGPLRPWAEELLRPSRGAEVPFLGPTSAHAALRALHDGVPMAEFTVWSLLMWQRWSLRRQERRTGWAAQDV